MIKELKEAKEKYKTGMYIISATGKTGTELVHGKIRLSEHYNTIISDGFGVIYDGDTNKWAEIVENPSSRHEQDISDTTDL